MNRLSIGAGTQIFPFQKSCLNAELQTHALTRHLSVDQLILYYFLADAMILGEWCFPEPPLGRLLGRGGVDLKQESRGSLSHFLSNYFKQWVLNNWFIAFGTVSCWGFQETGTGVRRSSLEGLSKLRLLLPSPLLSFLMGF